MGIVYQIGLTKSELSYIMLRKTKINPTEVKQFGKYKGGSSKTKEWVSLSLMRREKPSPKGATLMESILWLRRMDSSFV